MRYQYNIKVRYMYLSKSLLWQEDTELFRHALNSKGSGVKCHAMSQRPLTRRHPLTPSPNDSQIFQEQCSYSWGQHNVGFLAICTVYPKTHTRLSSN